MFLYLCFMIMVSFLFYCNAMADEIDHDLIEQNVKKIVTMYHELIKKQDIPVVGLSDTITFYREPSSLLWPDKYKTKGCYIIHCDRQSNGIEIPRALATPLGKVNMIGSYWAAANDTRWNDVTKELLMTFCAGSFHGRSGKFKGYMIHFLQHK